MKKEKSKSLVHLISVPAVDHLADYALAFSPFLPCYNNLIIEPLPKPENNRKTSVNLII